MGNAIHLFLFLHSFENNVVHFELEFTVYKYAESKKNPRFSIFRFLVTMLFYCYYAVIMKLQDNKNDRRHHKRLSSMNDWEDPRPGFKWPVSASCSIDAPADKVWSVISSPGNLELCHPFCAQNPVHEWPGPKSRDEVHYLSGWKFERQFLSWIDGVGYDLEIGRKGGKTSFVSWRIQPSGLASSTLRIVVYPYVLQSWPLILRWLPHRLRLEPLLRSYLESVVRGFEWYIVRGEPVPRNQFGSHPWFSTPSVK